MAAEGNRASLVVGQHEQVLINFFKCNVRIANVGFVIRPDHFEPLTGCNLAGGDQWFESALLALQEQKWDV